MQLKQLLSEDNAVSPVIGVILMVAITVILAAVIASFVLGLGSSADSVQPNSSFSLDNVDSEDTTVTITLTDGDSIDEEEVVFRGGAIDSDEVSLEDAEGVDVDGEWNTGESITIEEDGDNGLTSDGGSLNIVWEESGGDGSATLASFDIEF